MREQIARCRICGRPYRYYNMTVKDQSKCPLCRMKEQDELAEADRELEEYKGRKWGKCQSTKLSQSEFG